MVTRTFTIPDDHWNYMCDLMKKTRDALDRDAPDDYFDDKQTLSECLDYLLDVVGQPIDTIK